MTSYQIIHSYVAASLLCLLAACAWHSHGGEPAQPEAFTGFDAGILERFWSNSGPRLPSRDFVEAVQSAALAVLDGRGSERRLVVLSIASEFSFRGVGLWQLFLTNLRNITFARKDGTQSHLARHLVANVMTLPGASADNCNRLSNPFGARCTTITSPIFTDDNYGYKSPAFYGLSLAKVLTILDALTLGLDVLFLDGDQVFFRNPLPYILARDIDVLVTGDCGQRDDQTPADRFPKINSNIGLLYFRSRPPVARAVADWMHFLTRSIRGRRPLLDQGTFVGAMERISTVVGAQHLSVAMLIPDYFPHRCMAPCGCNTAGVAPSARGKKLYRNYSNDTCHPRFVRKWYHFHVPCNGDMNKKATTLMQLLAMYEHHVGPVNSLSAPMGEL